MRVSGWIALFTALGLAPGLALAQEAVPPLQPPYPTAPPPMKWPMAVMVRGIGYEARTQTEDAVAALTARGFYPVPVPYTLFRPAEACLGGAQPDHDCARAALTGVTHETMTDVPLVLVEARLADDTLSWICIGRARTVTVSFGLADFFTPDLRARQTSRNLALACIERSLGLDRTTEHSNL
ncbi:MAG: hypothetical protein ACT6TH_05050 [Brevundimonas sp.]